MIKIANAPCSWGVLEFNLEGEAAGYEQVLDEIQETGYAGTELGDWGFMPTDPSQLREEIARRELDLVGAFVPIDFSNREVHQSGAELATRTAKLMKEAGYENALIILADENGKDPVRTKNAGRIGPDQQLNRDTQIVFCQGCDHTAKAVYEATGLKSVFHHHCAGFVETAQEVAWLMNGTDPKYLGLVLDMGHYTFGGGEPLEAMNLWKERIGLIHFKDCEPAVAAYSRAQGYDYFESVKNGVFCKLGKGQVNFPAIVKLLHEWQYDGWIVVEQDVLPGMGDPKSCAQANRDYLKKLEL